MSRRVQTRVLCAPKGNDGENFARESGRKVVREETGPRHTQTLIVKCLHMNKNGMMKGDAALYHGSKKTSAQQLLRTIKRPKDESVMKRLLLGMT